MKGKNTQARGGAFIYLLGVLASVLLLAVCSPVSAQEKTSGWSEQFITAVYKLNVTGRYVLDVITFEDIDRDLSTYKTFGFDYTNKQNPLLEKELFKMVEERLVKRGLVRDEENPQLLITMDFYVGKKENYIPPQTITTTRVEQVWSSGMVGFTMTGHYTPVPVTESKTIPGHTETSYYRNIKLNFLDFKELQKKPEVPPLVWMGTVESEGSNKDIRVVAPVMLNELLFEFPKKTGRPQHRVIEEIYFGALGLLVDEQEWWKIAKVFPQTPAEAAGLKPGDQLYKINGEWTKNGRYLLENEGLAKYKEQDPYYKYILTNTSGKEVEIAVKSKTKDPNTGKKKRTVKVKPVALRAFYYIDPETNFFKDWCPWM